MGAANAVSIYAPGVRHGNVCVRVYAVRTSEHEAGVVKRRSADLRPEFAVTVFDWRAN